MQLKTLINYFQPTSFHLQFSQVFYKTLYYYNNTMFYKKPEKIEDEEKFLKYDFYLPIGDLIGCITLSFRISLKEYKLGLTPSKYSLLLNQFHINSNNFIDLINEIMVNNFPLKYFEFFFKIEDDIKLSFNFLIILTKLGNLNSTNTKFLIIPKIFNLNNFKSKIWLNFCDKLLIIFFKLKTQNLFNLGLILMLIIFYINKLFILKLNFFKNYLRFYSKEERLESIGNYFNFNYNYYSLFCKNLIKFQTTELFFNHKNFDYYNLLNYDNLLNYNNLINYNNQNFYDLILKNFFF